jgi:hypothetical protein
VSIARHDSGPCSLAPVQLDERGVVRAPVDPIPDGVCGDGRPAARTASSRWTSCLTQLRRIKRVAALTLIDVEGETAPRHYGKETAVSIRLARRALVGMAVAGTGIVLAAGSAQAATATPALQDQGVSTVQTATSAENIRTAEVADQQESSSSAVPQDWYYWDWYPDYDSCDYAGWESGYDYYCSYNDYYGGYDLYLWY